MGRAGSSRFNCSMETSRATGLVRGSVAGAICSGWNSVPQPFAVGRSWDEEDGLCEIVAQPQIAGQPILHDVVF
jgi:hypothetical protein